MKATETIKTLMSEKKIGQKDMQVQLNMKSQSGVSQALQRDMRVSMLLRFLSVLDCELIIRDRATGDEWTVDE